MNEITEVKRLRAQAPLPDEERLAPQRARLLEAMNTTSVRRTRPGVPRRAVLIPAVAVGAAVAVGLGVVVRLPGDEHSRTAAARSGVLSADDSAAALELAAATVEKSTVTEPGPKQWVYEKSVSLSNGTQKMKWPTDHGTVTIDPSKSEEWTRWDGTGSATLPGYPPSGRIPKSFDPTKLQVWYGPNQEEKWKKEGYDDRSQRQFWRLLVTLPSDPDAMMKKIREKHAIGDIKHETQAQRDWREISVLFRSVLIPSKVQASMYRALAKIPGARVEQGVKDPLGRDAIGVFVDYPTRIPSGAQGRQEFFLDPKTYVYLGESMQDGEMVSARAAWGVVDKPGQRP